MQSAGQTTAKRSPSHSRALPGTHLRRRIATIEERPRQVPAVGDAQASGNPILHFLIERYREAYVRELDDFIEALETGRPCDPGFEAGRRALLLANAAYESMASGRIVRVPG